MSKYIQINPTYKATSFEDRMKPLLLLKEERAKQGDAYEKILENSTILDGLANSAADTELYADYLDWKGRVEKSAETLVNEGKLDGKAIRDYRREYLTKFKPLEANYKHKATQVARQAAESSEDVIFDKDFSTMSIKDSDPSTTYKSLKLSALEKEAYDDIIAKYSDVDEFPTNMEANIDRIYQSIDLEGYKETDKDKALDAVKRGYNKAIVSINDYKAKKQKEALDLEYAQKRNNGELSNNDKSTKYTIVDPITRRKVSVFKKDDKYYTDPEFKNEYVAGSVELEDVEKYKGMKGMYVPPSNSLQENYTIADSVPEYNKKTEIKNRQQYSDFLTKHGSGKARESLANFVKQKGIDPNILYASNVELVIYEKQDGSIAGIEVKPKSVTVPAGN